MSTTLLVGAVFSGLVAGSIYALVAISFNLAYRPTNVFNFAQGASVMVGGLLGFTFVGRLGLPWLVAIPCVVACGLVLGYVVERTAVRPVLDRSQTSLTWVITTLAVTLILESLVALVYTEGVYHVPVPAPFSLDRPMVGGVLMSTYQWALITIAVLTVVLTELVDRSRTGRAILAVAEDREGATLRGINARSLAAVSFAASLGLATLAGMLAAPIFLASTGLAEIFLIYGFQASAVGGIGNNKGALLAGWLIGVVEAIGATLLSPTMGQALTLCLLLVILVIRPSGMFGARRVRRV